MFKKLIMSAFEPAPTTADLTNAPAATTAAGPAATTSDATTSDAAADAVTAVAAAAGLDLDDPATPDALAALTAALTAAITDALMGAVRVPLDLYAEHVIDADQNPVDRSTALEGKTIGLYFSAHWCGPCRQFTPLLAKKYASLLTKKANRDALEIVFISSDDDEEAALAYFESMPWKMLSFDQRELRRTIAERLGVRGIPCLVLLDKDGKVITRDGREVIMETEIVANIASFVEEKQREEEYVQQLTETVMDTSEAMLDYLGSLKMRRENEGEGSLITADMLKSKKIVGLLFAETWSLSAKMLLSVLVERFNAFRKMDDSFLEIIFISFNKETNESNSGEELFGGEAMPWLVLDEKDNNKTFKRVAAKAFDFSDLPVLVFLDKDNLFTVKGVEAISTSGSREKLLARLEKERKATEESLERIHSLPEKVRVSGHQHVLTKQLACEYSSGTFRCNVCGGVGRGAVYHCGACNFDAHIECAQMTTVDTYAH